MGSPSGQVYNQQNMQHAAPLSFNAIQGLLLRIEVKRVLHSTVLHCLERLGAAFILLADETIQTNIAADDDRILFETTDTSLSKNDRALLHTKFARLQGIEDEMWAHWQSGFAEWRKEWQQWVHSLGGVWNKNKRQSLLKAFEKSALDSVIQLRSASTDTENKN